jgi:LPXTG-motif cell wall-anchored protein
MRHRLSSILAATVLLALSVQAVSADALVADGDGLAPVAGARLDVGTICHAQTTTATVLVAVRATGHPNNKQVFDNGTTVTMTATVLSGPGLSASSAAPTFVMDPAWRSQPNQTMAAPVAWEVAVTPDAVGRYRGRLEFTANGFNRLGQAISRVARMNVIGRVVDCTAPVLANVPADLVIEADATDGADVTYVPPTATDAVDGAVAVDCDVPSSSRLPIGITVVSCMADDRAGNVATAAFSVTVADTTDPVVDGVPLDIAADATDAGGLIVDWVDPTATDAIDGPLPMTCDPLSGSLFPVGLTTVTCTASDAAGNVATASFTVDISAPPAPDPVIEDPADDPAGDSVPAPEQSQPNEPINEGVESGEYAPPAAPASTAAPQSPNAVELPDTGMTAGGTAALALGLLLVLAALMTSPRRARVS